MGYFDRKLDRGRARELVRELDALGAWTGIWEAIPEQPVVRAAFVRFVVRGKHAKSGSRTGVFSAAYDFLNRTEPSDPEERRVRSSVRWFEKHLPIPHDVDHEQAIFFFKSHAAECIAEMWALVHGLRDTGILVEMQWTDRPGRIVYDDEYQVGALPWADGGD